MKIFILNSSGNAGKSLLARELFFPRLPDAKILEIETVNSGGSAFPTLNIEKFKGSADFTDIYIKILETENLIMDVGASNLTAFWESMSKFAGVETLFDLFVIPTSTRGKIQEDTYKTILFLRSEGIPDKKIKIVFNEVKKTVAEDFEVLLSVDFPFDENLYIKQNESLFNDLGFLKQTIADIYTPDIESYKDRVMKEQKMPEKLRLVKMDLANRQAQIVKERMDTVFEEMTGLTSEWTGGQAEEVKKSSKAKPKAKKELVIESEESEISEDDEEL